MIHTTVYICSPLPTLCLLLQSKCNKQRTVCPKFLDGAFCSVSHLLLSFSILRTHWPLKITFHILHLVSL